MISFNNKKSPEKLTIDVEVETFRLNKKISFGFSSEEVLSEGFDAKDIKAKISVLTNQLSSKDRTKVINHFISSFYDFKATLQGERV